MQIPSFSTFSTLKRAEKATLRRRLFLSMLILALILTAIMLAGLQMFGAMNAPGKSTAETLALQLDFFEQDMESSWSRLTVTGIDLSEDITQVLEEYEEEAGISFSDRTISRENIEKTESRLLPILAERVRRVSCSGGFIILSSQEETVQEETRQKEIEPKETEQKKAGARYPSLYVIREDAADAAGSLVLFRGLASVARENGMNLHGKWRQDFLAEKFPGYDRLIAKAAGQLPLEKSYHITGPVELAGTDEQSVFLSVPLISEDKRVYGLCGFEVSRRFFRAEYIQPTQLDHLICMFSSSGTSSDIVDADQSFFCGSSYVTPQGSFSVKTRRNGLLQLDGVLEGNAGVSYIGVQKQISVSYGDPDYVLTAMIPKGDYDREVLRYFLQNLLLLFLFLFLAVVCCLYFSRRFVKPVLASLKQIKEEDFGHPISNIAEFNDLDTFLQDRHKAHQEEIQTKDDQISQLTQSRDKAEKEADRLAYSRKTEIDPLLYDHFRKELKTLTATEMQVLKLYVDGLGTKEVCEKLGIKESTLRFHNKNIYSKLGVNSKKQAVLYASVALRDQKK